MIGTVGKCYHCGRKDSLSSSENQELQKEIAMYRETLKEIREIVNNRDHREGLSYWSGFIMIDTKCNEALHGEMK